MQGHVYWITGLSGVGKTTIGTQLFYKLKQKYPQCVLLDGDVVKRLFGENPDYSVEGRKKRAFQYAELCKLLSSQGITVICCTIAMFNDVRDWNRTNILNYNEIFIDVDINTAVKRDVKGVYKKAAEGDAIVGINIEAELPTNPDIVIHNSMDGYIENYVNEIIAKTKTNVVHDIAYWNNYYISDAAPKPPSDFAKFCMTYMQPGRKVIDLGCGNGRDSVYFCEQQLKVTAVDLSSNAIDSIDKSLPVFTVCDDFVSAKVLFSVDYDYCYARWSIHAISKAKQVELFTNVYNSLREGGLFFIEARTIHDAKYGMGEQLGEDEYFYDNHYRRFIRPEMLAQELKDKSFDIVYLEEGNEFSIMKDDMPHLVRIIVKKS